MARKYYRKKLHKHLKLARDEEFIQLLWATNALQSNYEIDARKFFKRETIPEGAITTDMQNKFSIHKWELETLANELMTVPKDTLIKDRKQRSLDCANFQVSINCASWLREIENHEYGINKKSESVFIEMGRIAARQFDWQSGFYNIPQFYRNTFVYGQGKSAAYFEQQYGITINRFSEIGFILFMMFTNFPVVRNDESWAKLGITSDEVERVLSLIALPFSQAAEQARINRRAILNTADKPSILRGVPCLRFGSEGEKIRAPLPELILERITSGLFYDVVGGGDQITNDYGKRFEKYCFSYLSEAMPSLAWEKEFQYGKKGFYIDTPDILCSKSSKLDLVIECKATRLSHEAMFGKDPIAARGYEDLTKAVFQLWRFFSHCRRGLTGREVVDDAIGVVLTLNNWLVLATTLRKRVLEDATKMANEKEPEITEADKRPIVFVATPELERTLPVATEETFRKALNQAGLEEFSGYRLDVIHSKLVDEVKCKKRAYPFSNELGKLLPWWDDRSSRD